MRVMLADGSVVDSADLASVSRFRNSHRELLEKLSQLAEDTRNNSALAARIKHKYRLKKTPRGCRLMP